MRRHLIAAGAGWLLTVSCTHGSGASSGASLAPVSTPASTPEATGRGGAAATVDVRATSAAIEILKGGGNAVDAAVAAAAVLGATDLYSCGIGGGGFMVIYRAEDQRVITVEHREMAPRASSRGLFYAGDTPIPMPEVMTSGVSAGVPGMVQGWEVALSRYGTRGFAEVLQPAIRVAEQGFEVDQTFFEQTSRNVERFKLFSSSAQLLLPAEGKPVPVGAIFRNPDLAKTYRRVAQEGSRAFYRGDIARAIVDTVARPPMAPEAGHPVRPGVMTLADLSDYEARIREPVKSTYRGYTVYGMGAPTSGGITVELALNILEGYEPSALGRVDFLHRYLEASRLAFADRTAYVADPEYVDVPVAGLLSKDYAAERRKALPPAQAASGEVLAGNPFAFQVDPSVTRSAAALSAAPGLAALAPSPLDIPNRETTHVTTTDKVGNIVAYTCSIEYEGGNGMVVPGYGFLLNNELTDFDVPPAPGAPHANTPEPGKRPRSSMSPTLVFKDGAPVLALGSPGGSTIITTVLQTLIHHLDFGMPVLEAVAAPRVSQRNTPDGKSQAEPEFIASPEAAALQARGHVFTNVGPMGALTGIRFHPDGTVTAIAEPRRRGGGSAMVVEPVSRPGN
ncbi:gamma-glutamyltransferase [Stigmatella aurantiaca]|uniref:Glutathione hydrolase proenzyme n=1 Tax=Stigmatella aurantiaca (strain DW4/3-1) TaxID=378806 RepID=Q099M0_STIAD|nr:gamma-glutamyltransferase [Stigmatella aurantiaca]ADO75832.1 Gamma-glutamyltransferase [Stigmatella aurantiaca DW4/3-1]EAU68430.1 gamma-glutamyltransferase [Stigmatella aurantiaca DW4/3-1]